MSTIETDPRPQVRYLSVHSVQTEINFVDEVQLEAVAVYGPVVANHQRGGGALYNSQWKQETDARTGVPDPEQNGIIERLFCSLKEEYVWQHTFRTFEEARRIIQDWVRWYNQDRPHQALGDGRPVQYRAQQSTKVACL